MTKYILTSVEPSQVKMYLKGNKDTEIRKSAPNPKPRLDQEITEVPFVIKTKGSDSAYVRAEVSGVVRGENTEKLWEENNGKLKFGISRSRYDEYYAGRNSREAVLIEFGSIQLIKPPIESLPGTQTYQYVDIDEGNHEFKDLGGEYRTELIEKTEEIMRRLEKK